MEYIIEEIKNVNDNQRAVIKVIGVGGGGTNMIDHMLREGTFDIDIHVANTDAQHLDHSLAQKKIQLGQKLTRGLGAGSKPDVGKEAAIESYEEIKEALSGANLIFISAGMGGGTGTGAAPIIAQAAKEVGALTIGVVTVPFNYEGKKRKRKAEDGLSELQAICDQVIVIENEKLNQIIDKNVGFRESYKVIDDILYKAVHGVSGIILTDGQGMNVDFADVNTIMSYQGQALMGIGYAKGDDSAREAVRNALTHPLMDSITIDDAKGFLAYFQFNEDYSSMQMQEAFGMIADILDDDASDPIYGYTYDNSLATDEVRVTIVATGIGDSENLEQVQQNMQQQYAPPTQQSQPQVSINVQQPIVKKSTPQSNNKPNQVSQASYAAPTSQRGDEDELDYPSFWKKYR